MCVIIYLWDDHYVNWTSRFTRGNLHYTKCVVIFTKLFYIWAGHYVNGTSQYHSVLEGSFAVCA